MGKNERFIEPTEEQHEAAAGMINRREWKESNDRASLLKHMVDSYGQDIANEVLNSVEYQGDLIRFTLKGHEITASNTLDHWKFTIDGFAPEDYLQYRPINHGDYGNIAYLLGEFQKTSTIGLEKERRRIKTFKDFGIGL